jgi:uncharacterized membrane protein
MRKTLEALGIAALALLAWVTYRANYGPAPLPPTIPTHFAFDGRPNAWGSLATLWLLPAIGIGVYLVISLVALFPASFNYPVRVTPANRPRLQALTLLMIAWIKFELAGLFLYIQWSIIQSVRDGRMAISPFIVPISIGAIFATVAIFIVAILRIARTAPAPRIKL